MLALPIHGPKKSVRPLPVNSSINPSKNPLGEICFEVVLDAAAPDGSLALDDPGRDAHEARVANLGDDLIRKSRRSRVRERFRYCKMRGQHCSTARLRLNIFYNPKMTVPETSRLFFLRVSPHCKPTQQ